MSFKFLIFNFELALSDKRCGEFSPNSKLKTQNLKLAAKQFNAGESTR
jgi:hypothetical protein